MAILGRQPELGLVELESVLGPEGVEPFGSYSALLTTQVDIKRLGGSVNVGRVIYRGEALPLRSLPVAIESLQLGKSKVPFALSAYGTRDTVQAVKAAGLELKKELRVLGPVRLVMPARGLAVSAAELKHNRVIEQGFELLVVVHKSEMVVGLTEGAQDIDWYSKRDYGRPMRSARVGMLPPKLAQMLVNSTRSHVVADPFCGTGVVLQEAMLLGRRVFGFDLSNEMVIATKTNVEWLLAQDEVGGLLPPWDATKGDAATVRLPRGCAVVSEGYLGRPLSRVPTLTELASLRRELLKLYRSVLSNWTRQLPPDAEVSLCVPAWRIGKQWHYLGIVDELASLGYTAKGFKHVRGQLLYERPDHIVGRQLLFLRKSTSDGPYKSRRHS